jgi:hypothetical protein
MAKPKKRTVDEVVKEFFLGQLITGLTMENYTLEIQTAKGTLTVSPTHNELLDARFGQLIKREVTADELNTFIKHKTLDRIEHTASNSTIMHFTSGESCEIAGTPDIQTDIKNTYTIMERVEEELLS